MSAYTDGVTRQDPSLDLRIGSLFTGYGGLDIAVQSVLGGHTVWVSDICRTPTDGNGVVPQQGAAALRVLLDRLP